MTGILLAGALLLNACGTPAPTIEEAYELPATYAATMDEIRARASQIDQYLVGSRFDFAQTESLLVLNLAHHLQRFKPARQLDDLDDYHEYVAQANDVKRTGEWIHYYARLQRKADAIETLDEFVTRYNRLTKRFGPGEPVSIPVRDEYGVPIPAHYRNVIPGERIYR